MLLLLLWLQEMDDCYIFNVNELLNDPMLPDPVPYPQHDLVFINQRLEIPRTLN